MMFYIFLKQTPAEQGYQTFLGKDQTFDLNIWTLEHYDLEPYYYIQYITYFIMKTLSVWILHPQPNYTKPLGKAECAATNSFQQKSGP